MQKRQALLLTDLSTNFVDMCHASVILLTQINGLRCLPRDLEQFNGNLGLRPPRRGPETAAVPVPRYRDVR